MHVRSGCRAVLLVCGALLPTARLPRSLRTGALGGQRAPGLVLEIPGPPGDFTKTLCPSLTHNTQCPLLYGPPQSHGCCSPADLTVSR